MGLKEQLYSDMKESLKSGDKTRLATVRLALSGVQYAEIAKRGDLTEDELVAVVAHEAKRRREAMEEFEKGGRMDLVEKEAAELEVLKGYLPELMPDEDLKRIIAETVEEVGATSPGDLGKVMGRLMPRLKGRADGKLANRLARELLEEP